MRKLFVLLVLTVFAAGANAQVLFKNGINPNTIYTTNRAMKMVMNMTPPEALAAIAGGQAIKMEMTFNSTSIMATSARNKAGQVPLSFTSKVGTNKITMNGQEMPANMIGAADAEMTGYGRYDGKTILVDSIPGRVMNDSLKNMMVQIIESARNNSTFPDHPIKVGDTFSSDAPFALPLPGLSNSPLNVKSTYKLVSLNGSVGVFELTIDVNVDLKQELQGQSTGIMVSGKGTGTMTFDAKKQYYTGMDIKMLVDFGINTGGIDMKGKGEISVNDKVDIASK